MATRRRGGSGLIALSLSGLIGVAVPGNGPAQVVASRPPSPPAMHPLDRALQVTLATGQPTVAVVTSTSSPDSHRFWADFAAAPEVQDLIRTSRLVQITLESNPAYARTMGVKTTPTVLVYGKGSRGLELVGQQAGMTSVRAVVGWLTGQGVVASSSSPMAIDPALMRAGFHRYVTVQASPQAQAPPAQAPPAQAPPAQAPPTLTPVVSAPAQAPVVISAPSTPVVLQPQSPTIIVGPAPPPNIVFAAAPPSPPNVLLMTPTSSAPPNLFLSSPPAQAPPAAAPPGPSPQQAAAPSAAPTAPSAAPTAPSAAPTNVLTLAQPLQAAPTLGQQQSPVGTAVVGLLLENPSLIRQLLGALGRFLTRLGNPTLRMGGLPQTSQVALSSSAPIALVPVSGAQQVSAPVSLVTAAAPTQPAAAPTQPAAAPVCAPAQPSPQAPMASPQSPPHTHRHWFFHHD